MSDDALRSLVVQHELGRSKEAPPEVDFALVVSRMIDDVKRDPQQLRQVIYELARHKLLEQFLREDAAKVRLLSDALEIAIERVEKFSSAMEGQLPSANAEAPHAAAISKLPPPGAAALLQPVAGEATASPSRVGSRRPRHFPIGWRLGVVVVFVGAGAVVVQQHIERLKRSNALHHHAAVVSPLPQEAAPVPHQRIAEASATPSALPNAEPQHASEVKAPALPLPTSFGIYALGGEKLYSLEPLPGRAPDPRVAISATISSPSRTSLPDGQVRFIIFRRDGATNAADHAEIRLIARVISAPATGADGKSAQGREDAWVIRNVSYPFQVAPVKDNADMYQIQSEDPDFRLGPGRYALVVKGTAYDFSVDGDVTDPRMCLEKVLAANGTFYAPCRPRPDVK